MPEGKAEIGKAGKQQYENGRGEHELNACHSADIPHEFSGSSRHRARPEIWGSLENWSVP